VVSCGIGSSMTPEEERKSVIPDLMMLMYPIGFRSRVVLTLVIGACVLLYGVYWHPSSMESIGG